MCITGWKLEGSPPGPDPNRPPSRSGTVAASADAVRLMGTPLEEAGSPRSPAVEQGDVDAEEDAGGAWSGGERDLDLGRVGGGVSLLIKESMVNPWERLAVGTTGIMIVVGACQERGEDGEGRVDPGGDRGGGVWRRGQPADRPDGSGGRNAVLPTGASPPRALSGS